MNQVRIWAANLGEITRKQWQKKPCRIAHNVKDYNMRKEIDQSQTSFTWDKPINEHNSLYAMMYAGRRHVVQYQSILENFLIKTKSTDLISAFYLETR